MWSTRRHLLALAFVVAGTPLHAQEAPRPVDVRGYGSWSYGRTTANHFLAGDPDGAFQRTYVALNLSKKVDDRLSLRTQGFISQSHDGTEVRLDFAFAEYKLSERLAFRVGQVTHPFGIYTEVFDVGTLRPFIDLPQGFYGPVGFAGESYTGIGITGAADVGAWTVLYDAYAGGNELERSAVPEEYYRGSTLQVVDEDFERQTNRNVVGGRFVLQTPIQGLSFGSSSYTGIAASTEFERTPSRYTVVAGQVGYRSNALTIESEVAHAVRVDNESSTGGYVLAAYRLTPAWQIAGQYDHLRSDYAGVTDTPVPSLRDHRQGAIAVSRWLSRALVLKAEYHRVSGNRFAMPHPENLLSTLAANQLRLTTHLVQFGAQFTF